MKKILLSLLAIATVGSAFAQDELFFSEIVEGTSHNKAFEIFNPTSQDIDLSGYQIKRYNNGALTPSGGTADLSGTILAGDVWVIAHGTSTPDQNGAFCDSILQSLADVLDGPYPAPTFANGDDALTIEKDGVILDIFGKIGEDPGTAWSDSQGAWWTSNHTLIRKPTVTGGVTTNPTVFDVTMEWDSLPVNTWDSLGSHHISFAIGVDNPVQKPNNQVFLFPNPSTTGDITVKGTEWVNKVVVYNMAGQMIVNEENSSTYGALQINIEEKGIFLVQVHLADGSVINKKASVQ